MSSAPADGGRRSRRGFAYQDAVTLLDCLDMHEGMWTQVSWEDLEDIVCVDGDAPVYRQVKTIEEAGKRHSVASVCAADIDKKPESSYLGKLFLGKPLSDNARFTFIINESPHANFHVFVTERGKPRGPVPQDIREDIVKRLRGVVLPNERDIGWCVDRLEVLVEGRTIEEVEDRAIRRLGPIVGSHLGQAPLSTEVEDIMVRLLMRIARSAMAPQPCAVSAMDFREMLLLAITQSTGRQQDGTTAPLTKLADKLAVAGVSAEEAEAHKEKVFRYRRAQRASVSSAREQMEVFADEVFAVCTRVMAERRAGRIPAGSDAYFETLARVENLPAVSSGAVTLARAHAVLADITARCQNRYADAS
ncbi:dsDNA nuclease domain-containing protein [Kitasatospora sp. NPDC094015]|uniref:dsDNA nuclease domain-containing protein n=1 Tax=Kitasatospora sp. NPDC094015 TaxID=3155205 RepID=UPI0033307412